VNFRDGKLCKNFAAPAKGAATAAHQVKGNNVNSDFFAGAHAAHSMFKVAPAARNAEDQADGLQLGDSIGRGDRI
jgi:hypothetical protein